MLVVPAVQVRECGYSASSTGESVWWSTSSTKVMLAAFKKYRPSRVAVPRLLLLLAMLCMQHLIISQHSSNAL